MAVVLAASLPPLRPEGPKPSHQCLALLPMPLLQPPLSSPPCLPCLNAAFAVLLFCFTVVLIQFVFLFPTTRLLEVERKVLEKLEEQRPPWCIAQAHGHTKGQLFRLYFYLGVFMVASYMLSISSPASYKAAATILNLPLYCRCIAVLGST